MNTALLLQWHYMIFLLPFAMGALFLLLSSVRIGGGHRHGPHASSGHRPGVVRHTHSGGGGHKHGNHAPKVPGTKSASHRDGGGATPASIMLALLGVGRAPLPMVIELFCLAWGLSGYWANRLLLRDDAPSFGQMLPSLGIALAGGFLGSRLAAELIGRLLPREETSIVSRNALFGLTGRVVFPVSETSGRVHVYDEFGTLHDEMCRVAPGLPTINKGRAARIADVDPKGYLLVEEAPEPIRSGK